MEYDETSGKGNATINLTLLDGQEMDSKQLNSILATIDEKIKEYEFNSIDEDSKNDIDNIKEENTYEIIKKYSLSYLKDNGKIIIKGLEAGTYYLKETKTEKGYTLLANPVKIEINETPDETTGTTFSECKVDGNSANKVEITENSGNYYYAFTDQNNKGFNLPATGGMGTYLFTIRGLEIMAAAVFLLITFKKKRA